jgi:hypothetical protein
MMESHGVRQKAPRSIRNLVIRVALVSAPAEEAGRGETPRGDSDNNRLRHLLSLAASAAAV